MWRNFPTEDILMPAVVVDTHTIVWHLSADPRLSANAADALDSASNCGRHRGFFCERLSLVATEDPGLPGPNDLVAHIRWRSL